MQNTHRKRGNMTLHYSLIALIVLIAFVILSLTVFFNIDSADIIGSSIYSAEEIIDVSGIKGGDNMIRKNMSKAENSIVSNLIYIEEAHITRKLPSTVEILIVPCVETASLQTEDGYFIVSESGRILSFSEEPMEDTLVFIGTEPSENLQEGMLFASDDEDKTEVIYELIKLSDSSFGSRITSFDVSDRLNISCVYEDRITIEINSIADIEYKFKLAEEIISSKISPDAEGKLKMLESGAQFLSASDLEHNNQVFEMNFETSGVSETLPPETESDVPDSGTSVSTRLNFE